MAPRQVITISSQVAVGLVGNSVIFPTMLALGVSPIALSTIMLSNHPGLARPEGLAMPADKLAAMLERLIALGYIEPDAVIVTGYFANAEQIEAVAGIIGRLPNAFYLCDPVLGDMPEGLYIPEVVASAIRDKLLPMAHLLTPNAFELGWLTGLPVHDRETARAACRALNGKSIVVTSLPENGGLTTALVEHGRMTAVTRPKLADIPHGTGDLLAGILAARLALRHTLADSIGLAVAVIEQIITASAGKTSLDLAVGLKDIAAIKAHPACRD